MKKLSAILLLLVTIFLIPGCQKDCKPKPKTCIDSSKICNDCPIPMIYNPVCGCNGITYGNEFAARNAGVTLWTRGACNPNNDTTCIDSSKICDTCYCNGIMYHIYMPVCGCNGVTYADTCQARKAGVKSWTNGPCNQNNDTVCIDPSKICDSCFCPAYYNPVCSCNGVTYGNECEAANAGIKSWTNGPCNNGIPPCVNNRIKNFQKESCAGANVREYNFQGKTVYVFEHGTCIADAQSEVIDSNCNSLGFLYGIMGNTKINGEDFFNNATFLKKIWEK